MRKSFNRPVVVPRAGSGILHYGCGLQNDSILKTGAHIRKLQGNPVSRFSQCRGTAVHRAVASLNGTVKFGLTGTPVENSLGDLHSLFTIHILAMITKLKQICCHPCLIVDSDDPSQYGSSKWNLFIDLASELLDEGMKFVVFSQYVGMLNLMEKHFSEKGVRFAR